MPRPEPGRVVVEVSHCGICGSDIHVIMEGWGKPGGVHGHEFSGVIAAVGDGVEGWAVGDEIVCGPSPKCGRCEGCRSGNPSQCANRDGVQSDHYDGAYARFASVDAASLLRIPAGLSPGARPRWPSRWRWRCTASPGRGSPSASRPWCSAPAPSARSPSRRSWRRASVR